MNAMDSQWKHEANNFAMDNNDYEKAFESYISDADDDGEFFIKKKQKKNQNYFGSTFLKSA